MKKTLALAAALLCLSLSAFAGSTEGLILNFDQDEAVQYVSIDDPVVASISTDEVLNLEDKTLINTYLATQSAATGSEALALAYTEKVAQDPAFEGQYAALIRSSLMNGETSVGDIVGR